ncbi:MAG: ABC transporter transmembrane domain-containing protein [Pseudomonadota bacterium]
MSAEQILTRAQRDPMVVLASLGANLLSLAIPMSMIHIYDRVIPNKGLETLAALSIMVIGAIFAEVILRASRRYILELSASRFEAVAYPAAISAILQADPAQSERASQGQLYRCVTSIEKLRNLHVGNSALDPLDLPFSMLFLGFIAVMSPALGFSVFMLLTTAFLVLRQARKRVLAHQIRRQENEERRHSFLTEVLRGVDVVKTRRIEAFMQRRYERLLGGAALISADTARAVQLAQGFTAAIGTLSPLFVGAIGAVLVIQGSMTVGSLAAVVLLTGRIIQPVLRMEAYLAGADNLRQHREDLAQVLSMPARAEGTRALESVDEVCLKDVDSKTDPVFKTRFSNINLTMHRGECIALTGADRRTQRHFLRLLAGETGLERGEICLNQHPMESYALADRQDRIRLLSVDNTLIEGTLLENLTAFRPKLYRDQAVQLARRMGIEETITQSAEGYSLDVGPSSRAGLPQSLSDAVTIISGLVSEPDVILFDEANGALDRVADAFLLKLLTDIAPERLIIMVSNRPSFLKLATREVDLGQFVDAEIEPAA